MKKYLIASAAVFLFFLIIAGNVEAGGCCYLNFSSTNGIASGNPAHIKVAFTDPNNTYLDGGKTALRPLAGQIITVHIESAKSGQSCKMTSSTTNFDGQVEADCSSTTPGDMSIYFSAPNMDSQSNLMISQSKKNIHFDENPNMPEPTKSVVTPTKKPKPTPTDIQPTTSQADTQTQELQDKVEELEKKINEQQQEVNSLKALLDSILGFFNKLFN